MDSLPLQLSLLFILLCFSAFFSGSETTFFSLKRATLIHLKKSNLWMDKNLVSLLAKPRRLLALILLGNEFINVSFSVVIAALLHDFLGDKYGVQAAAMTSVVVSTTIILLFGEISPKSIAIRNAPQIAKWVGLAYPFLSFVLAPFRYLLEKIATFFVKLFGGEPEKESPLIMEEEFRYLVELGAKAGELEEGEKELIHNVFEFSDKKVCDVMTPIESVFALPLDKKFEELLEEVRSTQFSRIPVYEKNKEKFIGALYVKDLFAFSRKQKKEDSINIKDILRPLNAVAIDQGLSRVFNELRRTKTHIALVTNQQGRPIGIVTMDDILSELFGEVERL